MMWGAKVKTPVDMPDDMLKDAVQTTIGALQECENFDKDGNEVRVTIWGGKGGAVQNYVRIT